VKLIRGTETGDGIESLYPYGFNTCDLPHKKQALKAVLDYMETNRLDEICMETRIFIFHGYSFRISDGLITNFHMPRSSLLLLVSAFIGDKWKEVYDQALNHGYRFLSYGDSSLLIP
jgi:S-adenosylmethionine:tRNA ribosyltransferase-isomerase